MTTLFSFYVQHLNMQWLPKIKVLFFTFQFLQFFFKLLAVLLEIRWKTAPPPIYRQGSYKATYQKLAESMFLFILSSPDWNFQTGENLVTCNTFVSRNETYCVTGSIKLHVYEPTLVDMKKLTHKVTAAVGETLTLECPSLRNFNKTDSMIEWYKVSERTCRRLARNFLPDAVDRDIFLHSFEVIG